MEIFWIPAVIGLMIWLWFAVTMNGIYSELRVLNKRTDKQLEYLDYISELLGQDKEADKN
jgi:hypothetical protein